MKQIFNLKQLLIISLILFLLPTFSLAWDDVNCEYRVPVFIEGSTTNHVEEPVYIDVTAGHSWTDGQISFYDSDGDLLNYGNYTKNANDYEGYVFVNTTAGTNSTVYFYYDGATCGGSATATRDLYDDYENADQTTPILWVDELTWTGDCVEQNGRMEVVAPSGSQDNCYTTQTMYTGYWSLIWQAESSNFLGGFQMGDDNIGNGDYSFMNRDASYQAPARFEAWDDVDAVYTHTYSWTPNVALNYTSKLYRDASGNFDYYINNTLLTSWTDATTSNFPYIFLRALANADTGGIYVYEIQHWDVDHNIYDVPVIDYYEGVEEAYSINSITINAPLNTTYYDTDITLNFTVLDDTLTNINTWYTIDGTETYYNATNNTDVILNVTFTTEGVHYINITSENFDENRSDIVYFTVELYDLETSYFTENTYYEGEVARAYQIIRYYTTDGTLNNYITFNSTDYDTSLYYTNSTHFIYYVDINLGPENTNQNYTPDSIMNFTISGISDYQNETMSNITIYTINLDDCSVYSNLLLVFNSTDELNSSNSPIFTFEFNGEVSSTDGLLYEYFNFTLEDSNGYQICSLNPFDDFKLTADINYFNTTDYGTRNYYFDNAQITDTNYITLYLLDDTNYKVLNVEVKDSALIPQSDVIVKFLKYDIGTNSYKLVAMTKSDGLGKGITQLIGNNNYYNILLEKDGEVLNSYAGILLVDEDQDGVLDTLQLSTTSTGFDIWSVYGLYSGTCEFVNETYNERIRCTYSDSSGLFNNVYLNVDEVNYNLTNSICTTSSDSNSGTLICSVANQTLGTYHYQLIMEFSSTYNYTIYDDWYGDDDSANYDNSILIVGLMFTIAMFLTGNLVSPQVGIILGVLGFTIMGLLEIIKVPIGGISTVISLGLLTIWVVHKK